ncbi:MAG: hypothetical protein WBL23_16640 [Salinisphaera sp.]|uniref:hypothetical protein n=1 Tax=Salinisphaera sp. TaxID=1914330 RepID=UPI003C7B0591
MTATASLEPLRVPGFFGPLPGIQNLRKECPERVLTTEQSASAETALAVLVQMSRGNQTLKTRTELTKRMPSHPGLLVCPYLTARSRFAAKRLQMKTGQIKRRIWHAILSLYRSRKPAESRRRTALT